MNENRHIVDDNKELWLNNKKTRNYVYEKFYKNSDCVFLTIDDTGKTTILTNNQVDNLMKDNKDVFFHFLHVSPLVREEGNYNIKAPKNITDNSVFVISFDGFLKLY